MGGTRITGSQLTVDAPGGLHLVAGSWLPAAGANPTGVKGKGFTVAWTSAGLWTVTLNRTYSTLISSNCSLGLGTVASMTIKFLVVDVSGAGTLQICTDVAGTATDPTASTSTRVSFALFLSDTVLNA